MNTITTARWASIVAALGWFLIGLSDWISGDSSGAFKAWGAALTTAGLPAAWTKFEVSFTKPADEDDDAE